jgi:hypothetical protein
VVLCVCATYITIFACAYARTIRFKDQPCATNGLMWQTKMLPRAHKHTQTQARTTHTHTHTHTRTHTHTHTHRLTDLLTHSRTHSLTTLRHAAPAAKATHTHTSHKLADRRARHASAYLFTRSHVHLPPLLLLLLL